MTRGEPLMIQKLVDGTWEDYLKMHSLKVNPYSSRESDEDGGEQAWATIDFTVRWCKELEDVQFSRPSYRLVWRGHKFDIRRYDDYMNGHIRVRLRGVARA